MVTVGVLATIGAGASACVVVPIEESPPAGEHEPDHAACERADHGRGQHDRERARQLST